MFVKQFRHNHYRGAQRQGIQRYIVLRHMVNLGVTQSLIMQGSKVLQFVDPDFALRFIDSLSFLSISLDHFPMALGFRDKAKGFFFLHKFSSEGYLHDIGPYTLPSNYDQPTNGENFLIGTRGSPRVILTLRRIPFTIAETM